MMTKINAKGKRHCTVHITGAMQPLCGETTSPVPNISSEHVVTFLLGCQAQFPAVQFVWPAVKCSALQEGNLGLLLRLPLNESQAPGMVQHRSVVCAAAEAAVAQHIHQYVLLSIAVQHRT